MNQKVKKIILSTAITIMMGYILVQGGGQILKRYAEKTFYPVMVYAMEGDEKSNFSELLLKGLSPFYSYMNDNKTVSVAVEDDLTYEMILAKQENDEDTENENIEVNTQEEAITTSKISMDKLRDFNYLLSKFYTVDSTTTIDSKQLNVDQLLSKEMQIDTTKKGPKVLIFHTHSQEAFTNSVENDKSTTIVGMGEYLAKLLNEKGIETIHHEGVYDLINGKLDRSNAYQMAEIGVKEILNQYPSIEVVIDLHRDGVPETTHLVTEINGKQTAKIMFFNGLSRTRTNGEIAYLPNPYIQDNLSFSLQMQLACEEQYPGFARRIYLKAYRYSLHMMPKSLLIEAGAQTNSVEEVKNAMEILANILVEVLL